MVNVKGTLLLCAAQFLCSLCDDVYIVGTVDALQRHFMTQFVSFIQFGQASYKDLRQDQQVVKLQKQMTVKSLWIMTPQYESFQSESRHEMHPINIILSQHSTVLNHFNKLRCVLSEHWVLFLNHTINPQEFFSETDIPFNCEFLVAQWLGKFMFLTEVYRVAPHLPLKLMHFGTWSTEYTNFTTHSFQNRRSSMDGHELQAITIHLPPYTSVTRKDSQVMVNGAFGEIWNEVQRLANFTCKTKVLPEAVFGMLMKNRSWTGMVGMLERSETDVAIGAFTMTAARSQVISYTKPILHTRYCLLIGQPEPGVRLESYLSPFSWKLWLAVLCSIFVFSMLLCIVSRVYDKSLSPSLYEILFLITSTFCLQGGMITTKTWPCRLIHVSAYIVALTIMAAYSGALISYLTIQEEVLPFNSFQELLEHGVYMVGVKDNTAEFSNLKMFFTYRTLLDLLTDAFIYYTRITMATSRMWYDELTNILTAKDVNNTMLHNMYKKLLLPDPDNIVQNYEQGMRRMCSMKFAFWGAAEPMLDLAKRIKSCKLLVVPGCCTRSTMAIALRRESPYTFIIRHHMLPLLYNGVLNKANQMVQQPREIQLEGSTSLTVNLKKIAPLLFLLCAGIITSASLLVIERYQHRRSSNKNALARVEKTLQ